MWFETQLPGGSARALPLATSSVGVAKAYSVPQARQRRRGQLVADLRRRMQSAGLAGVGAMVILNSVYYTGARMLSQFRVVLAGRKARKVCAHGVTDYFCYAAEV